MRESAELIYRLENSYGFECEGGRLKNCVEWTELKERLEWLRNLAKVAGGCAFWGKKESGTYGPCGKCDYCTEYQND